jgi:hypothetical protein
MSLSAVWMAVTGEYEKSSDKALGLHMLFPFGFTCLTEHVLSVMTYPESIPVQRNRPDVESSLRLAVSKASHNAQRVRNMQHIHRSNGMSRLLKYDTENA